VNLLQVRRKGLTLLDVLFEEFVVECHRSTSVEENDDFLVFVFVDQLGESKELLESAFALDEVVLQRLRNFMLMVSFFLIV
jgi:hypothetical protein